MKFVNLKIYSLVQRNLIYVILYDDYYNLKQLYKYEQYYILFNIVQIFELFERKS